MGRTHGARVLEPGRQTLRGRVWTVIRNHGERRAAFTVDELLAATAEFGEIDKTRRSTLQKYLQALSAVGILRRVGVTPGQAQRIRHRLARDIGPKRPIVRRDGTVFDPNADQLLDPAEARA